MSDKRICKYCGMELSEDVPHGLRECNLHAVNRIAELKGVIEILEDQQREAKNILIDKNLHIDSLYEEGYKLQQRIAELETDNAEFRQLIHDWIIILTPDDGYVPDSECVRQAMLVIDKEREKYG